MKNKFNVLIITIIVAILAGWGEYIIPRRLDISHIQVVEVAGLDYDKNAVLSLVFVPHTGIKNEDKKQSEINEKYVTVSGDTFAETIQGIQHYEDHIFVASHLKNIILGEKLAQNNLREAMDFIGKDDNFRLNSKVYIAKEMSASDIFREGIDNNYVLSERIDKLSLNKKGHTDVRTVEVIDVMKMLLSDSGTGVIPCIQIVKNREPQLADYYIETSEDEKYRVEFFGYGVISDGKLVEYLGKDESNGYDYVKNLIDEDYISVELNGVKLGIALIASKANILFDFDNNDLRKIIIKIKTNNYILENSTGQNIFDNDVKPIEELENEKIRNVIMSTVDYSKQIGIDFLNIGETLKFYHPYKWRGISDNWNEILKNVEFEVLVDSEINNGYGILAINSKG